MGLKLGMVGLGAFGACFAPLFASHPLVDSIASCDLEADRLKKYVDDPLYTKKLDAKNCTTSFDELCEADLDAIIVITQPWLHAPQCIKALDHGKHVYSAVPVMCVPDDQEVLDWSQKVIDAVERNGKEYMLGETTIYRPGTMFCRRMAKQGLFGDFVYAEAEYAHDLDKLSCSLRQVREWRSKGKAGQECESIMAKYYARGFKSHPMAYPTHSVSGIVDIMRAKPVKVSAYGFRNRNNDPYFANSDFSNISALFQMDNGAAFRVCEMREISPNVGLEDETLRIYGTRGSFASNIWRNNGRTEPTPEPKDNKAQELTANDMFDPLPDDVKAAFKAACQPNANPEDDFVPQGHGGSHPYLVHEFVSAVAEERRPAVSAWDAAMYMAMGAAADLSARKDGEWVDVVDFGKTWD